MNRRRIMVIAGEASGDTLGAELVRSIQALSLERGEPTPPEFFGAGGPRLAAAGVDLAVDLTAHAVVGVWEVLRHYGMFRRIFHELLALASARHPAAIILIDYPYFNLRFVAAVRRLEKARRGPFANWHPKIIYYVSPQLWAWHPQRAQKMARQVDLLMSIFPFEPAWYASRAPSLRVEFVGHPVVDRYAHFAEPRPSGPANPRAGGTPNILLLPGSRARELSVHLPVLAKAVRLLTQPREPGQRALESSSPRGEGRGEGESLRFSCVVAEERHLEPARAAFAGLPVDTRVGGLPESLARADVAVAASGTVTVECAWFAVPTVVIYKTSPFTYFLGKKFIEVKYLAMPNLLAEEEIMPELIQNAATGENIASNVLRLLQDAPRREQIRSRLGQIRRILGEPGASRRAAALVLDLL